jgi:hypothetical protein
VKWRGKRRGREKEEKMGHTLFAIVPLILAINTTLPPFPNLTICFAAACAVIKHPVTLTLIM